MKAIILAAGQGSRLKKYTENLPKGMLLFDGKTLIERQIALYRRCGIDHIIVVRGYAAEQIQYDGVTYYDNDAYLCTNMVESLFCAKSEFDDDMIISYSDILFSDNLLKGMMEATDDFVCAVDDNWKVYWKKRYGKIDFDTESMKINEQNHILSLGMNNPKLEEIDARYIGLLKFSEKGLQILRNLWEQDYESYQDRPWQQSGKTINQAYMTDLLQALIKAGHPVKAKRFRNGWIEFDTNEDYEKQLQWLECGELSQFIEL